MTADEPPKTEEENPVPRFKTEKERADATLKALDEFDKKYARLVDGGEATLFRAGVYFDLGRLDEAATAYAKFLEERRIRRRWSRWRGGARDCARSSRASSTRR